MSDDNPRLKYLEDVPWDNSLKLSNGKVVHGLEQLPMVIKFSDEEVFQSHVNDQKNDFSNWIRDIIGYKELADSLLAVKTKDEFLKFMEQAIIDIKHYKAPEQPPSVIVPVTPTVLQPAQQVSPQPIISSTIVLAPVDPVPVSSVVVSSPVMVSSPAVPVSVAPVTSAPVIPVSPVVVSSPVQNPVPVSPIADTSVSNSSSASTPVVSPIVTESQMFDAPKPGTYPPRQPEPDISNTISSNTVSSNVVSSSAPVVSSAASVVSPAPLPVSSPVDSVSVVPANPVTPIVSAPVISATVVASSPVQTPAPVSVIQTVDNSVQSLVQPVASPEEVYDFEEIFKLLISELEQEVLAWDVQIS
ncbi:MAG: hypothetical protein ACP5OA_03325 [Candidatus Woesearchaeota archaeon]